ncbi:MAG: TonB-dependent receptor [Flavobacteriales bacterium]|nr:TonB-dependent receptor [Flavobacteriales bacterium]
MMETQNQIFNSLNTKSSRIKKNLKRSLFSFLMLASLIGSAQELTQTVRGKVSDIDLDYPLIGATVVILNSEPIRGVSTDLDGYFKLEGISVGKVSLEITYLGYEKRVISNIEVVSAKEVFLTIELTESVTELGVVEISGKAKRNESINEMAIISSRQFSTEETKRYAGTIDDPARMAANFAGVSGDASGNNDIVVRGNSPKGILWRMEGIEIPNPNHFSAEGATGGPVNALNSKMISNSEFMSGAFAPEYGNASSGVFDINLRQGNNEQREYSFGAGLFGTDFTVEGPIKKGKRASYLANYRYSSLGILDDLGVVDFGGVPRYQDVSFNFYLPSNKAGVFKVFGLAGISNISDEEDFSEDNDSIVAKSDFGSHLGFVGLSHSYLLNEHISIKSSVSVANNGTNLTSEKKYEETKFEVGQDAKFNNTAIKFATTIKKKIDAKNKISVGLIHTYQNYSFNFKERKLDNSFKSILDVSESSSFTQLHATFKHRFNENLSMVTGMHFLQLHLNNSYSIEPRLGFNYQLSNTQTLSAGFGVHSKTQALTYYTTNVTDANGNVSQPNKDLKLPIAEHYVFGHDYQFAENVHLKTEVYYQYLYNIAVEDNIESDYSLINQSDFFSDKKLTNKGEGKNYGVEITLEHYFADDYFYLFTASLYESKYQALNKKMQKSKFNGNYTSNFLIGKEYKVGASSKNKTLLLSSKITLQGGNRYTPLDLKASILADEEVNVDETLSKKGDDIFQLNLAAAYRVNKVKTTHEFKLEVLNASNNQAVVSEFYSEGRKEIIVNKQLPMLPNFMYTFSF